MFVLLFLCMFAEFVLAVYCVVKVEADVSKQIVTMFQFSVHLAIDLGGIQTFPCKFKN